MTPRQKRMATVVAILAGVGIATAFAGLLLAASMCGFRLSLTSGGM